MKTYDDYKSDKSQPYLSDEEIYKINWTKFKIVVSTIEDKKEIMDVFKHIHYDTNFDGNYITVNQLAHECHGDNILVNQELYDRIQN